MAGLRPVAEAPLELQNGLFLRSAPVAQLDRANASGALGREFESLRAHHSFPENKLFRHNLQGILQLV